MNLLPLTADYFSDEGGESKNKDQECQRASCPEVKQKKTLEDQLHHHLASSDPFITAAFQIEKLEKSRFRRPKHEYDADMKQYIIDAPWISDEDVTDREQADEESDEDSDEVREHNGNVTEREQANELPEGFYSIDDGIPAKHFYGRRV